MDFRPLLVFDLDGARFAVDATRVRESVWLPELTPVEESPPWVAGLFSLRGRIVPVTDLRLRFGHPARRHRTEDQVVVLEADHMAMGLIVSEIREVIELPHDAIQSPPQFDAAAPGPAHLVVGEAHVGDDLVTLLDTNQLMHPTQASLPCPPPHAWEDCTLKGIKVEENDVERMPDIGHFCPEATPAERALFRTRALKLRETTHDGEGERLGLAVVELGGEFFGVELAAVQEFCDIRQLSPIPCCPPHILGAMNLRGNLLTLIDPRAALNLPPAARGSKAVITRTSAWPSTGFGEQSVGIAVDEVHDVVYLLGEELQAPPAVLRERSGAEITGTAPYAGRMMTVLDLPALLAREEWVVDENC